METLRIKRLLPEERYESLGLSRNPFPSDGAFLDPPRLTIFPGERLREELEGFLNALLHRPRGAKGRALIGDYGTGKTHYLKYIRYFIKEKFPEVATFYVEHPGHGFHDFSGSVISTIGLGNVVRKLWSLTREELLSRVQKEDLNWYYGIFPSEKGKIPLFGETEYEHILSDYRDFFDRAKKQKSDTRSLLSLLGEIFEQSLRVDNRVARKLARVLMESHYKSYFDWEDITLTKQKEIGGYEFLSAVLTLIKKVDAYRCILILVDEFEEIPASKRFTVKEATDYQYTIRRLLDLVSALPLGMIITMTPLAWDLTKEYCEPLASRLMRPIHIEPLTKEGARKLVVAYLNDAREKKDILDPLPSDLWDLLPEVVRDNPRNLLNCCHDLAEAAASKQMRSVDVTLVKEFSKRWRAEFKETEK